MTARGTIAMIGATTEQPTTVTMTTTVEGGGTRTIVPGAEALPGTTMEEEEEEAGREEGKLLIREGVFGACIYMWQDEKYVHVYRCLVGMAEEVGPRKFL